MGTWIASTIKKNWNACMPKLRTRTFHWALGHSKSNNALAAAQAVVRGSLIAQSALTSPTTNACTTDRWVASKPKPLALKPRSGIRASAKKADVRKAPKRLFPGEGKKCTFPTVRDKLLAFSQFLYSLRDFRDFSKSSRRGHFF